jgi:hypothetical protein
MSFDFQDLDAVTRRHMRAELELDLAQGRVRLGSRLTDAGREAYPGLLAAAIDRGDPEVLATALREGGLLSEFELGRSARGKIYQRRVPVTAATTLAEEDWNRYYMRALCVRAIDDCVSALEVYRAKPVTRPRPESQARVGYLIQPKRLLEDLRDHVDGPTERGLPAGPNSGVSVRFPRAQTAVQGS